ncbi:hypothetical protein [Paenibacillus endoradicis]|uniref:hypothetical protein n=1 Tax=Paenibacillus endoradicis TaxID=2972487 RepID=UPI002159AF17|nr:hypothetical protein [Paenibacillus endoradicis]
MAKHSETSWKQDHPSTLLSNSVQKADQAVKHAMSHPEEQIVEQAQNAIYHAENAVINAEQYDEDMDTVQRNKEQLEAMKQQLNEAQEIVDDRLY